MFADIAGDPEKISGWVVVYETDDTGATVRGNLSNLLNAVRSGGDIKIAERSGAFQLRICDQVIIFLIGADEHVGCGVNNRVALVNPTYPLALRSTPYITYEWFDTFGQHGLARASIYGGANLGQSTVANLFNIIWYARVR